MPNSSEKTYAGDTATAEQILCLAREYYRAACVLRQQVRRGKPISRAPFHLSAIHAIELYLNAMLIHSDKGPSSIRGMHHDLQERAQLAVASGLKLRKRTMAHLTAMTGSREYLVSRYDPDALDKLSQINRIEVTLKELAGKVTAIISGAK